MESFDFFQTFIEDLLPVLMFFQENEEAVLNRLKEAGLKIHEKCSALLISREIKIKTKARYLTPPRLAHIKKGKE